MEFMPSYGHIKQAVLLVLTNTHIEHETHIEPETHC
jgi:hypothetical protein